jgi:hypothetical protein
VAASVAAPTPAATVATKRRTNGYDWRKDDGPLVAEMGILIATKSARSAEDAARAVFRRAKGHGNDASKVKRLAKRYRDTCGVQPTTGFE